MSVRMLEDMPERMPGGAQRMSDRLPEEMPEKNVRQSETRYTKKLSEVISEDMPQ